jgi:hypothetical protein
LRILKSEGDEFLVAAKELSEFEPWDAWKQLGEDDKRALVVFNTQSFDKEEVQLLQQIYEVDPSKLAFGVDFTVDDALICNAVTAKAVKLKMRCGAEVLSCGGIEHTATTRANIMACLKAQEETFKIQYEHISIEPYEEPDGHPPDHPAEYERTMQTLMDNRGLSTISEEGEEEEDVDEGEDSDDNGALTQSESSSAGTSDDHRDLWALLGEDDVSDISDGDASD